MNSDWRARLRERGYRLTPQRELVLGAVEELGHATPDQVHAEIRRHSAAVNLSTVYRTLEVLEEIGLIRHTHLSDRAPTYHSIGGREHFHLVCRNCSTVTSVDSGEVADLTGLLGERYGFTPDIGHLTIFGTCHHCDGATSEGSVE
ncbi:Fur family transcriptional regulator [Nocardioides limicola]|uniref:Fur family transcriptional regulator n=1 Tax=Nocardioides limicola TaxID=2803368 RepID=UPI00193B57D2|nr:Fur family transcriptional regulator [Nocardioides sp. DJM-14]